jgi:hypothetical protein
MTLRELECTVRKVTFGGANSLDNFLARPDHAVAVRMKQ